MILLGCRPAGRLTEQHDIYFTIAASLPEALPSILAAWPEANGKIHIDAWRNVQYVDGYSVRISPRDPAIMESDQSLFFLNLGGYRKGEFEELHYKMLAVAPSSSIAIKAAKETAFYKHTGFKGATSHIDDKFGIDVDDVFKIAEILSPEIKNKFQIDLIKCPSHKEDELHLGYLPVAKIDTVIE